MPTDPVSQASYCCLYCPQPIHSIDKRNHGPSRHSPLRDCPRVQPCLSVRRHPSSQHCRAPVQELVCETPPSLRLSLSGNAAFPRFLCHDPRPSTELTALSALLAPVTGSAPVPVSSLTRALGLQMGLYEDVVRLCLETPSGYPLSFGFESRER